MDEAPPEEADHTWLAVGLILVVLVLVVFLLSLAGEGSTALHAR